MIRCSQEGQHHSSQAFGLILINRLAAPGARRIPEISLRSAKRTRVPKRREQKTQHECEKQNDSV
jgi:hypothetical protein